MLVILTGLFGVDRLFGVLTGVGHIRQDSLKFRSEVARLVVGARHIAPNVDHLYFDAFRPEQDRLIGREIPRRFRSDASSAILGNRLQPPSPRARIVFLGGSTTECNEVDEPFRFPAAAGNILTEKYGIAAETYNLGVRGHTTQDSLTVLINHPLLRQATHVVVMHNINDRLWLATRGDYSATLMPHGELTFPGTVDAAAGLLSMLWNFTSMHSNLLFASKNALERRQHRDRVQIDERVIDFEDPDLERSKTRFETNLRVFIAAARAYGQVPILMTQPLGRPSPGQAAFNGVIRTVAQQSDVPLVDAAQALGETQPRLFFRDLIHLSNEGSLAVADAVARTLVSAVSSADIADTNTDSEILDLREALSRCLPASASIVGNRVAGPRRRILVRSGRYPSVSPDLQSLTFHDWTRDAESVWVYELSTKKYRQLVDRSWAKNNRHPAFLPAERTDRSQVVFGSNRGGFEKLYMVPLAGGIPVPVLRDDSLGGSIPAVDTKAIVFAGARHRGNSPSEAPDLFEFDRASRMVRRLTQTPWEEWRPALAPDGMYVYYISNERGDFDIFRLRRTPPYTRELVYRSPADEWDPTVSADGKWLAFASRQMGHWHLYLLDLADIKRRPIRLTETKADDWDPHFLPDSRALLFASSDGRAPHMYLMCPFGERSK